MSLYSHLKNKAFAGNADLRQRINGKVATAAPSAGSYPYAKVGELIYDQTNNDWYFTTVAGTTWVRIYNG
jgi:hypothetical protein